MAHLMKLELKKIHFLNYILIVVFSILASMFFITVALNDSSPGTDTFATAFRVIEMIFAFVFVILFSVLNASIVMNEYNNKTILIMFSYPVDRNRLIMAKLLLITLFVAFSKLAGYAACGSFIVGMDYRFDWIEGDFGLPVLRHWINRALSTTFVFCNLGLWTFAAGMWKKSVPMTIVSSVLFIYLRQIVVASTENYQESIGFLIAVALITSLTMWYTFVKKVAQID